MLKLGLFCRCFNSFKMATWLVIGSEGVYYCLRARTVFTFCQGWGKTYIWKSTLGETLLINFMVDNRRQVGLSLNENKSEK